MITVLINTYMRGVNLHINTLLLWRIRVNRSSTW